MDPIGAISLVSLLLILAMCAGMLLRRFVYGKELAELKKNAGRRELTFQHRILGKVDISSCCD